MTLNEVMAELERMGSEPIRRIFANHGNTMPCFGVKVGDLKTLVKRIKRDDTLGRQLYATGCSDAMYLAGLITRGEALSPEELNTWAEAAHFQMISEYTVAWLASEHPQGWSIALRWLEHPEDHVSAAGWSTLSAWVGTKPDAALDLAAIEGLLERVQQTLHGAPNRTRYAMNGFVLAVGAAVVPLTARAREVGAALGTVEVNLGNTSCKVPEVLPYLEKIEAMGRLGQKRKTARC